MKSNTIDTNYYLSIYTILRTFTHLKEKKSKNKNNSKSTPPGSLPPIRISSSSTSTSSRSNTNNNSSISSSRWGMVVNSPLLLCRRLCLGNLVVGIRRRRLRGQGFILLRGGWLDVQLCFFLSISLCEPQWRCGLWIGELVSRISC